MPKPPARRPASRPGRSRFGCSLCKEKRVKCDEARPACGRCTRMGLTCPGYQYQLRWSTKYEVLQPMTSTTPAILDSQEDPFTALEMATRKTEIPDFSDFVAWEESTWLDYQDSYPALDPLFVEMGTPESPESINSVQLSPTTRSTISPATSQMDSFACSIENDTIDILLADENLNQTSALSDEIHEPRAFSTKDLVKRTDPHWQHEEGDASAMISIPTLLLSDLSSLLINHYFEEVAGLYSCFDSPMNPFKTTVARLLDSSNLLSLTVQSMAASCLIGALPHLADVERQLRYKAKKCIVQRVGENDADYVSLLALLMLGQTASWHNPKDLGLAFRGLARPLTDSFAIQQRSSPVSAALSGSNLQFFQEAFIYWDMLLSFTTSYENDFIGTSSGSVSQDIMPHTVPHPWTGISREVFATMTEVGKLIRHYQEQASGIGNVSSDEARKKETKAMVLSAQKLVNRLLALVIPNETEVIDPKDESTPVGDLIQIAKAYRYTGLLQLFRVFGSALDIRQIKPGTIHAKPADRQSCCDLFKNLPLDGQDESSHRDIILLELTKNILAILEELSLESGTKFVQPFLLVAISSELTLPITRPTSASYHKQVSNILKARKFVRSRLISFQHCMPPRPAQRQLELVQEVWSRSDRIGKAVFWMDLIIEPGWETALG